MRNGSGVRRADDLGLQLVNETAQQMEVGEAWSIRQERGFTWWAHRLAQSVWAEPGRTDSGFTVWRVACETDLVRAGRLSAEVHRKLGELLRFATLSGLVHRPQEGILRLHASVFVHEENAAWVGKLFQAACAMQVGRAEAAVEGLSSLLRLEPAFSSHPTSGPRHDPDAMVGFGGLIARDGAQPSQWKPEDFESALAVLEQISMLALGDEEGLTAEFPVGPGSKPAVLGGPSSLFRAEVEQHPAFGQGLLLRLHLPGPLRQGRRALHPVALNTLETGAWTRSHLLGSWCGEATSPVFVCFLPKAIYRPGMLVNLCFSFGARAMWVAELAEG